jgi:hypothetical protein
VVSPEVWAADSFGLQPNVTYFAEKVEFCVNCGAVNRPIAKVNLANLLAPSSAERAGEQRFELLARVRHQADNPFFPVAYLTSSVGVFGILTGDATASIIQASSSLSTVTVTPQLGGKMTKDWPVMPSSA